MFGGGSVGHEAPALSAIAIQEMGYGAPIQICYGTNRVSPVLGWTGDFRKTEVKGGGGGKGGGGAGGTSYKYDSSVLFFVCEGQVRKYISDAFGGFGKVWRDKKVFPNPERAQYYYLSLGSESQTPWDFLVSNHAAEALSYPGLVLAGARFYPLSEGASLGNHSYEIHGVGTSIVPADQNYLDAHIKDVIADFLHNDRYGAIDPQTATLVLETAQMHDYCRARNLLISPLLNSQKPAHEYLTEWAAVANAGIVWSEGKLKLLPYADQAASGTHGSYTPETAIRYAFNDDNVTEPISPKRKKSADCFNKVTIECLNRSKDYNKHTVEAKDQAGIEESGLRPADTLTLECLCNPSMAIIVAHTVLQRGLYIRNEYTIQTWCDADLLEPMDFITVTDADLGLSAFRCRIVSISHEQDGAMTIVAEEAPSGVYSG